MFNKDLLFGYCNIEVDKEHNTKQMKVVGILSCAGLGDLKASNSRP